MLLPHVDRLVFSSVTGGEQVPTLSALPLPFRGVGQAWLLSVLTALSHCLNAGLWIAVGGGLGCSQHLPFMSTPCAL